MFPSLLKEATSNPDSSQSSDQLSIPTNTAGENSPSPPFIDTGRDPPDQNSDQMFADHDQKLANFNINHHDVSGHQNSTTTTTTTRNASSSRDPGREGSAPIITNKRKSVLKQPRNSDSSTSLDTKDTTAVGIPWSGQSRFASKDLRAD